MIILFLSTSLPFVGEGDISPENASPLKESIQNEIPIILQKIAWCESKNKQYNADGTVHRGVQNRQDVGKFQINEHYHLTTSQKLGIDIYTLEGNTEYALYLYKINGTRDWNWSKWCWSDETVTDSEWLLRFKANQ